MAKVKVCPSCSRENIREDNRGPGLDRCSYCRYTLVEVAETDTEAMREPTASVASPAPPPPATPMTCECGAELPPGATDCQYCHRPVSTVADSFSTTVYALRWPWGEITQVKGRILIGRVPPVDDAVARRLEQDYPNVSRMHAELSVGEAGLLVRDFNSMNGTYVNGKRIEAGQSVTAPAGATLRFASRLEAVITLFEKEKAL